jgi:release factor glutamine methyltransferase
VLRLLRWSAQYLEEKGVPEPRLDAEHLLAHALGSTRLDLYLEFDRPLTPDELARFKPGLKERARRRPLQYILGTAPFRELRLAVDERVIVPRPETEELVDAVLARVRKWGRTGLRVLDVGTGSGAIALSLAREGPFARVLATDRSPEALEVARANARSADIPADAVEFREGDLLVPVSGGERFHVVVSNLPYVSEAEYRTLQPEVRDWEPRDALVAPGAGLALLEALVAGAPDVLEEGGLLALEVGQGQSGSVADMVRGTEGFESPEVLRDLSRRERMVLAVRRS